MAAIWRHSASEPGSDSAPLIGLSPEKVQQAWKRANLAPNGDPVSPRLVREAVAELKKAEKNGRSAKSPTSRSSMVYAVQKPLMALEKLIRQAPENEFLLATFAEVEEAFVEYRLSLEK